MRVREKNITTVRIPVVRGPSLRHNIPLVAGFLTGATLVNRYEVPYRDTRTKEGYQRTPSKARINKLKTDLLKNRVDLPTAVLLNLRSPKAKDALKHDAENGTYVLDLTPANPSETPTPYGPLYVVDGQHRIVALHELLEDDYERWKDFAIPFICMLGATVRQEMEQFYVVNSTAKSVRTDLALDLLKQRAESDPRVMEQAIERGEGWKVVAQDLVERLADSSPVWRGRIRFANEPKAQTVVNSSSMATSLKELLDSAYIRMVGRENQLKIIDAYWRGIRDVLQEAFNGDPNDFSIQKGIGVMVMHSVLVDVLEYVRAAGKSPIEADSYEEVLAPALTVLQGENGQGEIVSGSDFWRAGHEGAAGSFSSSAGRRVLSSRIKALLPDIQVE